MKPLVTRAGFQALTCNRCGVCCEGMNIGHDGVAGIRARKEEQEAKGGTWGMAFCKSYEESVAELELLEKMLVAIPPKANGVPRYRCTNFSRDAEGLGVCGIYETRPAMCSRFPYDEPSGFAGCSWNVRIVPRMLPVLQRAE